MPDFRTREVEERHYDGNRWLPPLFPLAFHHAKDGTDAAAVDFADERGPFGAFGIAPGGGDRHRYYPVSDRGVDG